MPSSKSSSSSRRSSVTEQITKQLEAHTLLSNVTVNIDDLALSVKLNIKVDQRVQVKIPLKALVTYENAEIVPGKEDNEKVKGDNSSSDSDAGSEVSDNKPTPAPKPVGNRTCRIAVKDLPKESVLSKVDPYFKLYVDGFHVFGSREHAQSGKKDAEWSFQVPQARLFSAKTVRIEWFDKDKMSKDDMLGVTEFPAHELKVKMAVMHLPVVGTKTTKAGTKMGMFLSN